MWLVRDSNPRRLSQLIYSYLAQACPVSLKVTIPQYFIGKATHSRSTHLYPFPSIERNLNGQQTEG
jgi:hypothetical protein